jgi:prepilin-type processing-associated H-X9-DG protein
MYAQDSEDWIPAYFACTGTPCDTYSRGWYDSWSTPPLHPFVKYYNPGLDPTWITSSHVMFCPSMRDQLAALYGSPNLGILGANLWAVGDDRNPSTFPRRKLSALKNPGRAVVFGDSSYHASSIHIPVYMGFPHREHADYVFADGHVATYSLNQLWQEGILVNFYGDNLLGGIELP